MNAHMTSPKFLVPAALAFAAYVLLAAAGVRAVRDRAPPRAGTTAQAHQAPATGGGESAELCLQSLVMRGGQLRDGGSDREAEPFLDEALTLAEKAFGPDSIEAAVVLNQIGMLGKYDGHFDQSEVAYRRALHLMEQTTDLEHPLAATLFHNQARPWHTLPLRLAQRQCRRCVSLRLRA
ncbi:MAG: tetratricopeptide repeat protein [Pyrinomonadaceae bacterium]|nr:tetratricopeptide repeat protein [Pyrinomonadaceae bacterium]